MFHLVLIRRIYKLSFLTYTPQFESSDYLLNLWLFVWELNNLVKQWVNLYYIWYLSKISEQSLNNKVGRDDYFGTCFFFLFVLRKIFGTYLLEGFNCQTRRLQTAPPPSPWAIQIFFGFLLLPPINFSDKTWCQGTLNQPVGRDTSIVPSPSLNFHGKFISAGQSDGRLAASVIV
jgi:hypothetical protein